VNPMDEKAKAVLLVAGFLAVFFLPTGSPLFQESVLSGFIMLNEYAQEHVLTCLVPAFFIAGAIAALLKKDTVLKYLSGKANKWVSYGVASVSRALLAVCSCTILPIFAGIHKRGAGIGPATTFLFSGPAINVAAIFLTMSVLGYGIGFARLVAAIVLSIAVGLCMAFLFKDEAKGGLVLEKTGKALSKGIMLLFFGLMISILIINGLQMDALFKWLAMVAVAAGVGALAFGVFTPEQRNGWFRETWSFTKLLVPYLFVGVFVAGAVQPLLPQALIESLVGGNTVEGNLMAAVFGAFMYFSTLTEIPILQPLMAKGMGQGPALALLLAGPSLSLPNMLVISGVLGKKRTLAYIALVVVFSTIAGLVFGGM